MISDAWKPEPSDYFDALAGQNPWHSLGHVPEALSFRKQRTLTEQLWKTIIDKPRFQVILGPRRVGKTVCLYQTVQNLIDKGIPERRLWFMRMDHPLFLDFELGRWVQFLIHHEKPSNEKPLFLFIDEINYSRNWDLWLKTMFDEKWPVQVVATSSSVAALRNRKIESGIGRWSEQFLTPYSILEYLKLAQTPKEAFTSKLTLPQCLAAAVEVAPTIKSLPGRRMLYMLAGGFPEIILRELEVDDLEDSMLRSQQTLRTEAVQRVTGMDLPQVFGVQNPIALERLLYLLASQMCGIVSASNLSNVLDISRQTANQYIGYLEKAFLIFTLPTYATSEESVQRRGRKVYFVDGAVRNAALQRGIAPLSDPNENGWLIENMVASHLKTLSMQSGSRLYHWRNKKQQEIDFVYDDPSNPMAFEVATSVSHHLKGVKAFQERYPRFEKQCYVVSSQSNVIEMPEDNRNGIGKIPLDIFLIAVSGCICSALIQRLDN